MDLRGGMGAVKTKKAALRRPIYLARCLIVQLAHCASCQDKTALRFYQ
jgi:hypothetical protein